MMDVGGPSLQCSFLGGIRKQGQEGSEEDCSMACASVPVSSSLSDGMVSRAVGCKVE